MSFLLAALNTVAATPVPSPVVVKEIINNNQIPVTPPEILQLGQMLALSGAAAVTSIVHQIIEAIASKTPAGWSSNVNRLLLAGYSTAAALIVAYLTGDLNWTAQGGLVVGTSFLVALGSASGRYEFWRFLMSLSDPKPIKNLATDEVAADAPA